MPAELVFVCLLGSVEALVGLNDEALSGREIAMTSSIDVHDRGLGKQSSDTGRGYAEYEGDSQISLRHNDSPCGQSKFLSGSPRVLKGARYAMQVHNFAHYRLEDCSHDVFSPAGGSSPNTSP
jgi:hypothetical protein